MFVFYVQKRIHFVSKVLAVIQTKQNEQFFDEIVHIADIALEGDVLPSFAFKN